MAGFDDQAFQAFLHDLQTGSLSYEEARQRYHGLGEAIRQRYEREVTALAVDVVHSAGAGAGSAREEQATCDVYHRWVEDALAHFGYESSFSWSGDGLLAVFAQPELAVAAGRHLLDSLPMFNARSNRMNRPLQLRIGVHTGLLLTDQAVGLGKIASPAIDLAGHLQKEALPNQMRVSERTFAHLREWRTEFIPLPAEPALGGVQFAYPPHLAPAAPPALAPPVVPTTARRDPQSTLMPWLLAVAGLAMAFGVLLAVSMLWPRTTAATRTAHSTSPPIVYQEPLPANVPNPGPTTNTPEANPAATAPPSPLPAPTALNGPAERELPAPARTPPEWEPSRVLWRSPAADSAVPPNALPSSPEQKWLLGIGIGRYQESTLSAPGAGTDTRFAAATLQQAAGIPANHTMVLTEEQATLGMCKQAFKWLQQNATSGRDTVYVYLSGAAMLAPPRPGLKHPGSASYALFPYDARLAATEETAIYGADVAAWLGAVRAQTIVLVVDTNHAGAIDLPTNPDAGRGLALLAACGSMQQARTRTGQQAGLFPELLASGLKGAADGNRDGRVALSELKSYLELELGRTTLGAQTPDLRGGFGGAAPDVLFALPRH